MDARKLLCIFVLAQLVLVAYAKLGFDLASGILRRQGYDTSNPMSGLLRFVRDDWWVAWLVVLLLFVWLLRIVVNGGQDWRDSVWVFGLSFGMAVVIALVGVFVTIWVWRPAAYGYWLTVG